MKRILILLFVLGAGLLQAQHTISGTVTDEATGETLIGATVLDTRSGKGCVTNNYGYYTLTLKGDSATLRYTYVGYQPQELNVALTGNRKINMSLVGAVNLQEVVVTSEKPTSYKSSQISAIEVPVEQIKAVPVLFGETDVLKAMQLLPGVQSGGEGQSAMYVRGGGPDQNLFLLDGVPLYNVNHAGGFFSAFNSDAVKNVTLYKGSFPAHFGSRLSSVLDITTNNGNDKEFHGGVSVGLIAAKLNVEGPIVKEKTTFCFSARRTYGDVLAAPLMSALSSASSWNGYTTKATAGYYFYDVNLKVTHKFNDRSRLYASYYMGDDGIYARIKTTESWGAIGDDNASRTSMNMGFYWGNVVGSLRWNYEINPKLFMNVTGAFTRYRNSIAVGLDALVQEGYVQQESTMEMTYNSGIRDFTGRVDFDYAPDPDHAVKFGGGYVHHIFQPEVASMSMTETGVSYDTTMGENRVHAEELSAYIEDDWTINEKFKVNAGLNTTSFLVQGKFYPSIQPRVSGRMIITDDLTMKVGYAYMTQYLHLLANSSISLPNDLWVPVTARIKPMTSQQVAAGLFYNLRGLVDISVEGYYKYMNNLLEYKDGASFWGSSAGWEDKVCMGNGWSYGVEFLVQKTVGDFTGWLGYTWSKTERLFDRAGQELNNGIKFPAKYDRRHDLSLVLTYKYSKAFDISLSWVFCSGNTSTLAVQEFDTRTPDEVEADDADPYYNYYGSSSGYVSSRNNYRMPSYHRMDLSMNFNKEMKHGTRTVNVSVYNLYNRQNPFMVYESGGYSYNYQGHIYPSALVQLSIFPIIPSVSYIWKF